MYVTGNKQSYLCNSQKEKCTTCNKEQASLMQKPQPYNIQTSKCVQKIQNISTAKVMKYTTCV